MPRNRHDFDEYLKRRLDRIECTLECIEEAILMLARHLPHPIDLKPAIEKIRAVSAENREQTAKIKEALKQPTEPSTDKPQEK